MTEKELVDRICNYMKRYFTIECEVWSTDKTKRIDIVMVHHSDINKEYPFGIEVKLDEKKRGNDLGKWIIQASEYSKKEFEKYGKLIILACPQLSGKYLNEGELMNKHITKEGCGQDHNVATMLGAWNIGEVQKYKRFNPEKEYLRFVYKGQKLWCAHDNKLRTNNIIRLW